MSSYDSAFGAGEDPDQEPRSGPRLPGGISIQTAAAGLLIIAVIAVLWLLTVPEAEAPPDLATETPIGWSGDVAPGAAVSGTLVTIGDGTPQPTAAEQAAADAGGPAEGAVAPTGGTLEPAPTMPPTGAQAPPGTLMEGTFVRIHGTGVDGVRFRFGPGLNYATIRIAQDDEVLLVLGGPETGDGYAWWRLQDALGNVGWAAVTFLSPIAAPAEWSPPRASPTFGPGADADSGSDSAPTP